MHTVHRGIMTSESVTAALSAPVCTATGLFEASSHGSLRRVSCHVPQDHHDSRRPSAIMAHDACTA
eukprot:4191588-Prymnesium_polylepis.1